MGTSALFGRSLEPKSCEGKEKDFSLNLLHLVTPKVMWMGYKDPHAAFTAHATFSDTTYQLLSDDGTYQIIQRVDIDTLQSEDVPLSTLSPPVHSVASTTTTVTSTGKKVDTYDSVSSPSPGGLL